MKKNLISLVLLTIVYVQAGAQIDSSFVPLNYIKFVVNRLCAKEMYGRGYVENGMNKAGNFIISEVAKKELQPFMGGDFKQPFQVAVNQIIKTKFKIDRQKLRPGYDYLISPNSGSVYGDYRLSLTVDSTNIPMVSLDDQYSTAVTMDTTSHLLHTEDATIYPERAHLIFDSKLWPQLKSASKISVQYQNETQIHDIFNVGAMIRGRSDSFVFITAHYDHLGMLGDAMFPGASDNASGTAMMLTLANYFSQNPPYYNLVFIGFAAEETGLLGSKFFTENFDVKKLPIKMVFNLDIMGNAEGGITVVNTEEHNDLLLRLRKINSDRSINLPEIRQRGNTKNSDHYFFTELGIPAVFIYSNGGQGYYHDVYDTAPNLLYTNIDKVFYLLSYYILNL